MLRCLSDNWRMKGGTSQLAWRLNRPTPITNSESIFILTHLTAAQLVTKRTYLLNVNICMWLWKNKSTVSLRCKGSSQPVEHPLTRAKLLLATPLNTMETNFSDDIKCNPTLATIKSKLNLLFCCIFDWLGSLHYYFLWCIWGILKLITALYLCFWYTARSLKFYFLFKHS